MAISQKNMNVLEFPQADSLHIIALAALFVERFSIDWLGELSGKKPSEILSALERGCEQGILINNGAGIFSFEDAHFLEKFQDYWDPKEKERLHRVIADLLLGEMLDDDSKIRAIETHLLHIKNNEEYCNWLIMAGDANRRGFQSERALKCYSKALEDLSGLQGEKADFLFAKTAIKYSKVSMAKHQTKKVLGVLNEAICRADQCKNLAFKAQLKMQLGKNKWLRSEYSSALSQFREGWSIAEKIDDPKLFRSATIFRAFFLVWQGLFNEAVRIYEKYMPDVWEYPKGEFPLYAAQTMGYCYTQIGEITQGIGMLDTIRMHCLKKGEKTVAAHAGLTMGNAFLDIENVEEAVKWLHWSLDEAALEQNEWTLIWAKLMLSYAYYRKRDKKKCLKYLRAFLKDSKQAQVNVRPYPHLMEICWAIEQGALPNIQELSIQKELDRMIKGKNVFIRGVAYRYRALLQRKKGESHRRILDSLNLSLKWLNQSGHRICIAKSRLELARQYLLIGKEEKARKYTQLASKVLSRHNEELIPDDLRSLITHSRRDESLIKDILGLGQKIGNVENNKNLIQHIISTVNRIIGAERGAIFFMDGDSNDYSVQLRASRNLTPEEAVHSSFKTALQVIKTVARTGKGVIKRNNPINDPKSLSFENIRSCICVPMMLRKEILGVFYCDNRLLGSAFRDEDLQTLAYFGTQAAMALENSISHEKIEMYKKMNMQNKSHKYDFLKNLPFDEILGESPALKNVLSQVDQVSRTDIAVLITGETGVGKELLAKSIHHKSKGSNNSFVVVNCSALPETLLASELFGHEIGAFTGANRRRIGRFEVADGGTLFLDEIGDLPIEIQVRLLRALETKEFERLGGNDTIKSSFRLVAATNRNLEEALEEGKFRDDLYYRIKGFPIDVPPLRERVQDIPVLANHFLTVFERANKKMSNGIPEEVMERLIRYNWPGNVRELKNVIEWGAISSDEPFFRLPEKFMEESNFRFRKGEPITLRDNQFYHILSVLNRTGWKVKGPGGAAEVLDVPPSTLESKMKKLGISRANKVRARP